MSLWEITERGFLPTTDPTPFLSNVRYRYASLIYSLENLAVMLSTYLAERRAREEIVWTLRQSSPGYDDWTRHDIGKPATFNGPLGAFVDGEDKEIERAFMLYSYLASAYVWAPGETPAYRIPKEVAVPLYLFADKLKRQPILSYPSYCLYNWRRKKPDGPITLDNLESLQNFTWGEHKVHEDWDVLVHVAVEADAGPAVHAIAQDLPLLIQHADMDRATRILQTMCDSLVRMNDTLARMSEGCTTEMHSQHIRPYINGFKGVVLECVENNREWSLQGETGAQSSIIPCFSTALGIIPHKVNRADMRHYMPLRHQQFLADLDKVCAEQNLRTLAANTPGARELYDECVEQLTAFRTKPGWET